MTHQGILCTAVLVVAVNPVRGSYNLEGGHLGVSSRFYMDAAAMRESCALTGALEVCHSAELGSEYSVHVCPKDGLLQCNQSLCYYSSVVPCCSSAAAGLQCRSTVRLLVEGKTITVTHYQIASSGEVCVYLQPPVELCDKSCKQPCKKAESVRLEEKILAAVENVLENFNEKDSIRHHH